MRKDTPKFTWSEWTLYYRNDIPSQVSSQDDIGGNCGIHLCVWTFIICSSRYLAFVEKDMMNARKWIMQFIIDEHKQWKKTMPNNKITANTTEIVFENINITGMKILRIPPMGSQNTIEYCSSVKLLVSRFSVS